MLFHTLQCVNPIGCGGRGATTCELSQNLTPFRTISCGSAHACMLDYFNTLDYCRKSDLLRGRLDPSLNFWNREPRFHQFVPPWDWRLSLTHFAVPIFANLCMTDQMQIWKWKSTPASVLLCIVRSTYAAVSRPTISSSSVSSLRWQRNIALFEPVWFAGPIIFSVCCLCGTELCRGGGCLRDTFPLRWQWGQWQCWWQHPNYIDNGDIVGQFWDIIQSFLVLKTATCDYTKVDGDLCLSNRVSQNNALL